MGILASEPPSAVAAVFFSHPDTAQSGMMGLFKTVSNSGPAIIYKDSSNRKIKGHLHSGLETGASPPPPLQTPTILMLVFESGGDVL